MGLYPISEEEALEFSRGVVKALIRKVDDDEFKDYCVKIKRRRGYPLRNRRAFYLPRGAPTKDEDIWNDKNAPFNFSTLTHTDDCTFEEQVMGFIDVFGYQGGMVLLNNIIINDIDPFGLEDNDPLAEIVDELVKKQEEQFSEKIEAHEDKLRRLRVRYGARDPRYRKAARKEPELGDTVMNLIEREVEMLFTELCLGKNNYFELVSVDLHNRCITLATELGKGGPNRKTRYYGLLELGQNSRWEGTSMLYTTYAKMPRRSRVLHPFRLKGEEFRVDKENDLVLFIAQGMRKSTHCQELIARYSNGIQALYKQMFPMSVVPVRLVRP